MFVVSEAEADAIRAAFEQHGELSAAVELRRLFPSVTDNVQALACARTIAGWKPLPTTKLAPNRRRLAGKKKPRISRAELGRRELPALKRKRPAFVPALSVSI